MSKVVRGDVLEGGLTVSANSVSGWSRGADPLSGYPGHHETLDGSEIRELMHPAVHGNVNQSLAEARVSPGSRPCDTATGKARRFIT